MTLSSYKVLSWSKYIAPLVTAALISCTAPKIAAKDIKSMQTDEPITMGSYSHAHPTQLFIKNGVIARTANNRFVYSYNDFAENGPLFNRDDYGHGHWKSAGEDANPSMFNVIPKMPEFAYITGITPLGLYLPNKYDTQVNLRVTPEIVNAVYPNRIGFYESKKANFDQSLRSLMFDNANRLNYEASEWVGFLAKKGYSIETSKNAGILGLGVEQGRFAAAYYPKQGYLVSEMDFREKAKNIISRYGLDDREAVEAMKRSVLLHEIAHVFGVKGDRKGEKLQGLLQAEFYSMMADKLKGTKMEKIYRALAREGMDYARWHSKFRLFDTEPDKDTSIDFLIAKFEAEARALGLNRKELQTYVAARAYETYGVLLEDGAVSYSTKSRAKKTENKRKSSTEDESLEEKVESEEKSATHLRLVKGGKYSEYKDKAGKAYGSEKSEKSDKEVPAEEPATEAA